MSYGVGLRNGVAFALGTIPSLTSGGGLRPSLLLDFLSGSLDPRITFSRGTQAMQYGSDGTLQYAPNNLLTYSNQADNAAWTKSNSFVQQNLLLWSEDFTNATWVKQNITVTADSTISPFGTLTADTITAAGGLISLIAQSAGTTVASSPYAQSIYAKAGSKTVIQADFNAAGWGTDLRANFDLANGVLGTVDAGITATIENLGNGWYRCSAARTKTPTTGNLIWCMVDSTTSAREAACTAGTLYIFGTQLVQGSVPGDYQATTSAALPVLYADYNGALRARLWIPSASGTTSTVRLLNSISTGIVGAVYTTSVRVKAYGKRWVYLAAPDAATPNYNAWFDLQNGVVGFKGTSVISTSIAPAGNGYYLITATSIATSINQYSFISATDADNSTTVTADGNGIYIADAQLTPGYLPLAVTETTSAAVYGPRFDYDPSSLVTQNLLTYSNTFSSWAATNTSLVQNVAAPDGTTTAWLLTDSAVNTLHFIEANVVTLAGASTISIYAKTGTSPYVGVYAQGVSQGAFFNLNTGAFSSNIVGAPTSYFITPIGNGWYRCGIVVTSTAAANTRIFTSNDGSTFSYAGTGTGPYIWGAQLNRGSTALPYTATTTAPYTLTTARGLLIEEQRANLLLQSNDFLTSWSPINITRTLNATLSPEGVVNGVKIEATTAAATQLLQAATIAATAATGSVYVKQGTGATVANQFTLRNNTTATNLIIGTLNYSTGVFTYSTGSTGVVVTNVGNGWWRIAMTATAGITAGDLIAFYPGWSGNIATAGDFLYAYGAQLEAGAFATSYIPTVGSTATRNADSASITTLTPWYNTAAGTWYAAFQTTWDGNADQARAVITGDASATKRYLYIGVSQSAINSYDGTTIINPASGDVTGTAAKVASTYNATARTITNNAVSVVSGAVAAGYAASSSVVIGQLVSANYLCGWISAVRYYPTALPNASLQSITA